MADEFFADLLPLKPKNVAQKPGSDVKAEQGSLQASSESGSLLGRAPGTSFQEAGVGDLLGKDIRQEIPEDFASGKSPAATPDRGDKQAAQIEAAVQKSLHKFADALQPVLLSLTRQLDVLGSKVDQINSTLHASQTSSKQNDAILEHLLSLESGMKALKLSVEYVGKQQQALEANAKDRAATSKEHQPPSETPKSAPVAALQEQKAPSPAPSLHSNPSAVLPPGPALPVPTVPPLPATAPPATPIEQPQPQRQPQAPTEAAQTLQQYGSTASQQSYSQYAGQQPQQPQQPRAQDPVPQPQYNNPGSQQQQAYGQAPQQALQHGYPHNQQTPLAPQTPPSFNAGPQGPQRAQSVPQPQQPAQQYSAPPTSQPYSGSYQTPAPAYYSGPQETPGYRQQDTSPYSGSYGGPSTGRTGYPSQSSSGTSGYPSVAGIPTPQSQRYGGGPSAPGGSTSFPPPPRQFGGHSYPPARPGPPKPAGQPSAQNVPLEQVIDDIANMGFSRHDARSVIQELQDKGQAVDLNVVLDRLMNGPRR